MSSTHNPQNEAGFFNQRSAHTQLSAVDSKRQAFVDAIDLVKKIITIAQPQNAEVQDIHGFTEKGLQGILTTLASMQQRTEARAQDPALRQADKIASEKKFPERKSDLPTKILVPRLTK